MASIRLDCVSKLYESGHAAVRDLTLDVAPGELLVLVGPSGSGKSTVLRLVSGLETPTSGRVLIDGEDMSGVPPQRRDVAMVFQSYALYPHMTVRQNLAFGLRMRKIPRAEIEAAVQKTADMLGIDGLLDRRPAQLSGGQRQRVAVGRALARDARVFLLDEPLSNLDPLLRVETRTELGLLHRRLGATMMYVTHDQEEAMTLGTRIAVMRNGALEQVGAPLTLYRQPANRFVAGFIGAPAINLCRGTCARVRDRWIVRTPILAGELSLPDEGEPMPPVVDVAFRPHDVDVCAVADGDIAAQVAVVEALGVVTVLHVRVDGVSDGLVRLVVPPDVDVKADDRIAFRIRRDRLHLFDRSASGRRLR